MDQQQYDLYFRSVKVGVVTYLGDDFPNLWGRVEIDPSFAKPATEESIHLARFVELNREEARLRDAEEDEAEEEAASQLAALETQMEGFVGEYIETNGWYLVDEGGRERPILVPIFHQDGEIVWR